MWSKRDTLIFLAGAFAFHTLSHFLLNFSGMLPFTIFGITLTSQLNWFAIIASGLITVWLLGWAAKEK
ncbi:MAG: hypothetical protein ACOYT8_01985 [Candidatus Dependentiae bacterium]